MHKARLPTRKCGSDKFKDLTIALLTNILASKDDNFHKERLGKVSSCKISSFLNVIPMRPINLQIIPNTMAKVASEEKMHSIFMHPSRTKFTMLQRSNLPVPLMEHVSNV
jgi:hypothetical protein